MTYQFHGGQLVVCINDNYRSAIAEWCDVFPVAGQTYTVKSIAVCPTPFLVWGGWACTLKR